MDMVRQYVDLQPPRGDMTFQPEECHCEVRFARSLTQETYDRVADNCFFGSSEDTPRASVLLATETMEEKKLNAIDPKALDGHTRPASALVLMTEIQLRSFVDRISKVDLNQKTDGDESMKIAGQEVSKYSQEAMELGEHVTGKVKSMINKVFRDQVEEDSVFPTKNGAPKY